MYEIIYSDPPWTYDTKEHLGKFDEYPQMTLKQLKEMPVKDIINPKSCLLFLWVVSPMLKEGIELLESWGFTYRTIAFIWYKQRPNMGHYTMSECEICIVGKTGVIPKKFSKNEKQFLSQLRGKHSSKPHEIRLRIERMFPKQKKLEMFARQHSGGDWDLHGNEMYFYKKAINL